LRTEEDRSTEQRGKEIMKIEVGRTGEIRKPRKSKS